MLKIGIIGCGFIGTEICRAIDTHVINARLIAIFDNNETNCQKLILTLNDIPKIMSPKELI